MMVSRLGEINVAQKGGCGRIGMKTKIAGLGLLFIMAACTGIETQQPRISDSTPALAKPSVSSKPVKTQEISTTTPELLTITVTLAITQAAAGNESQTATPGLKFEQVQPSPEDSSMKKGKVFVDSVSFKNGMLSISGSLPTPCHKLRLVLNDEALKNNTVDLSAYSLRDNSLICIQSLAPFQLDIPLGNLHDGSYTVMINNDGLLTFDWPEKP
jgi:hypothetical protein